MWSKAIASFVLMQGRACSRKAIKTKCKDKKDVATLEWGLVKCCTLSCYNFRVGLAKCWHPRVVRLSRNV